jgi:hypothetical protein
MRTSLVTRRHHGRRGRPGRGIVIPLAAALAIAALAVPVTGGGSSRETAQAAAAV